MSTKPADKLFLQLFEPRFAVAEGAAPQQQAHRPAGSAAFNQQRAADNG